MCCVMRSCSKVHQNLWVDIERKTLHTENNRAGEKIADSHVYAPPRKQSDSITRFESKVLSIACLSHKNHLMHAAQKMDWLAEFDHSKKFRMGFVLPNTH